jgi:hypothetical protein
MPAVLAAACVAATLINPHGWHAWTYPLRYVEDRESLSVVSEWRSPVQQFSIFLVPYYAAFVLTALSLLKRRATLYVGLVAVCVLVLSLSALRNVPFVALMLLPVAGPALSSRSAEKQRARIALAPAAGIACAFLALALFGGTIASGGWNTLGDPPGRQYPEGGAAWIAAEAPGARLYNEYTWGGYLIYELPQVPVFVDGRTDFYRSAIMGDYISIGRMEDGWEQLVRQYGIDTMLLRKRSKLADELRASGGWRETFTGDVESVFVRVD